MNDLVTQGVSRILIVTRTPGGTRTVTRAFEQQSNMALTVKSIAEIDDFPEADAIILTAWPNSRRLGDVISRYLAPSVYLVAFQFEREWFLRFRRQHAANMRTGELDPAVKAVLTGLPIEFFGTERVETAPVEQEVPVIDTHGVVRIEDLLLHQRKGSALPAGGRDDTRPVRYIGFFGAGYAYLSEWQNVPVITSLVRRTSEGRARVSLRTVDALTVGDYVVFRGGAESNIIRTIAEQLAGREAYARWRDRAEGWRKGLQRVFNADMSQGNPVARVHSLLRRWGLEVGVHTVRRWLSDETQIGPSDEENLIAIAKATQDDDLLARKAEVWEAIRAVRALHLEAGRRLTELLLMSIQQTPPQVGSRETKIEVAGAPAWILQVEEIGKEYEERPSSQVNRLLWDGTGL
jgi:hypothetical protein